ncbi:hypothetical protein Cni_G05314 [Canna indica]|uniref:RNase H type-1 domain-containing protein n=1 Tax=Canna indica TaxID=4628 RepID=A0AAQ3Q5A9_9LILI|nr:hypothetical protein Cni_G05314 [Canna indica]
MARYCDEVDSASPKERREEGEPEVVALAMEEEEEEEEILWRGRRQEEPWPRKSGGVMLEGYIDAGDGGDQGMDNVSRTKSLTDEDLEELKGCLDLGFGFSYDEIPDLCSTLPALELCYSMSQRFLDGQQQRSLDRSSSGESMDLSATPPSPPIANWKISSPGICGCPNIDDGIYLKEQVWHLDLLIVVVRNWNGQFMGAKSMKFQGSILAHTTELKAVKEDLLFAWQLQCNKIIIEGDAEMVYKCIEDPIRGLSYNGFILHEIFDVASWFQ